jgi:hypothetical protein
MQFFIFENTDDPPRTIMVDAYYLKHKYVTMNNTFWTVLLPPAVGLDIIGCFFVIWAHGPHFYHHHLH